MVFIRLLRCEITLLAGCLGIGGKIKTTYFDNHYVDVKSKIDKLLPDTGNMIVSSTQNYHLVLSSNTDVAPSYYLFDELNNHVSEIADTYPSLTKEHLTKSKKVHIRSTDGIDMEAYLTQPKNNIGTPSKTIIFPHGGPWSRDINTFNPWIQFLANRGWNVIQINFRGSIGFGEEYLKKGFKQWGLKMQDDITDTTNWAISTNIADKQRVTIIGASYGGYAALIGILKYPQLYSSAIALAPVTDLTLLVDGLNDRRWQDSDIRSKIADTRIGDWWNDSKQLKLTSPLNLASELSKPILIAHGVEDRNVPVSHSRQMISELKDIHPNLYEYLEFEHSDHYLLYDVDRINFFNAMDAFLKKH